MTNPKNSSPILEIKDLTFFYGSHLVLEKANLSLSDRDFVSLIGPNGGGKTTLLKLILGLLVPQSGSIRVFGKDPREARYDIGYMPQTVKFDPQFPVTVLDVALMGRLGKERLVGPYRSSDRTAALKALREVGLAEVVERPFSSLSGGQQQRVLIARALACEPKLLLLDEPTSSLDIHVEEEFYKLLEELNQRLTIVLVSHDVGFVSHFVKTIVCVNQKVTSHPSSQITSEIISQTYGATMRMLHHHHD